MGDRVVVLDRPYALDKAGLLNTVALELRCRAVQRVRYVDGVKQISMHLFGYDSDLVRAEVLYTSLLLQAASILARTPAPPWENAAAFRRSWLSGFTSAIARRLRDAETRAETHAEEQAARSAGAGPSVSLVLADRATVVTAAVTEEYPRLRKGQSRSLLGSGGPAGWQAGQRADLGGIRLGGAPRERIAGQGGPASNSASRSISRTLSG